MLLTSKQCDELAKLTIEILDVIFEKKSLDMENKINIAELLKDCPKGMELNCTMFDNVYFERIEKNVDYPIVISIGKTDIIRLTKEGCWNKYSNAKCVIFPKGKTTWKGFCRSFVEGDIVSTESGMYIGIVKFTKDNHYCHVFCSINNEGDFTIDNNLLFSRFATEEEKQKLFNAIKANGYKWNSETKTLDELIKPIFKVGDKIKNKNFNTAKYIEITDITSSKYIFRDGSFQCIDVIDKDYKLISSKSNIITFKPFDKVLVRDNEDCVWKADFYSHYEDRKQYPYVCASNDYNQCIPYNEETAHLIKTTDDCPDKYKIWKDEE